MAAKSTTEFLLVEAARFLEPLADAAVKAPVPKGLVDLAAGAGLDLDHILVDSTPLSNFATALGEAYASLRPVTQTGEISPGQVAELLLSLRTVFDLLGQLDQLEVRPGTSPDIAAVGQRVTEYLLLRYLRRRHPALYHLFLLVGAAEPGDPRRKIIPRLDTGRLVALVGDPKQLLMSQYGWGSDTFNTNLLFSRLQRLSYSLHLPAAFEYPDPVEGSRLGSAFDAADPDLELRIPIAVIDRGGVSGQAGLSLLRVPTAASGPAGFALVPFGAGTASETIPLGFDWQFVVSSSSEVTGGYGLVVRPNGVSLTGLGASAPPPSLAVSASIERQSPAAGSRLLLGEPGGTRFEVGTLGLTLGFSFEGTAAEFVIELPMLGAKIIVAPGAEDGFLRNVMPAEGLVIPFDFTVGWSNRKGVYFEGSDGLDLQVPIRLDLGVVAVNTVFLAVRGITDPAPGVDISVAIAARFRLGPITATVDRVGLSTALTLPSGGGNLGPLQLDLGFQHPAGVGLAIDAGVVTGGGYLFYDHTKRQYAGVLELQIDKLSLKAFGLLTTRMPDGSPGFSLLVLIQASGFAPVPLGFGFSLTGAGGLLAVNRSVDVEVLRTGVRNRTLDAVLFSQEGPTARAPQIVSTLQSVFPPA
ncbi:MAG TPA: DUF6603 domain-containing protein, partial [Acidimicrobiales bacterium]|nr:DUF6603 domain-containing protein [Acidimicrobiales bacterium]